MILFICVDAIEPSISSLKFKEDSLILDFSLNLSSYEHFQYKQLCYFNLKRQSKCREITNCTSYYSNTQYYCEFEYERDLFYGENYTFYIESVACDNTCNISSKHFSAESGKVTIIFYLFYFKNDC